MTPTKMLGELAKSYTIELSYDGERFKLLLHLRNGDLVHRGDMAGYYIGTTVDDVVARAWAGERPNG